MAERRIEAETTEATLSAGATFTSLTLNVLQYDVIEGVVFADEDGTLFMEQAIDGTNWDVSESQAVTGGAGAIFAKLLTAKHARIRYVNGASDQGTFRLGIYLDKGSE